MLGPDWRPLDLRLRHRSRRLRRRRPLLKRRPSSAFQGIARMAITTVDGIIRGALSKSSSTTRRTPFPQRTRSSHLTRSAYSSMHSVSSALPATR